MQKILGIAGGNSGNDENREPRKYCFSSADKVREGAAGIFEENEHKHVASIERENLRE